MRRDLEALIYLESRQLRNRLRQTLRRPASAVLYLIVTIYIIAASAMRMHAGPPHPVQIPEPYASAVAFGYLALIGLTAYSAALGFGAAFQNQADARFLTGSLINERTVVLWLQLRRSAARAARLLLTALFYIFFIARFGTLGGMTLTIAGATLLLNAPTIPFVKLHSIIGRRAGAVSLCIAIAGALATLLALSGKFRASAASQTIVGIGAGRALDAMLLGNPIAVGAFYASIVVLFYATYFAGGNIYPEIYASSLFMRQFVRRSGVPTRTFTPSKRSPVLDSMTGAWTIIWKDAIVFGRSRGLRQLFWLGIVVAIVLGALLGSLSRWSNDAIAQTIAFGSVALNLALIFVSVGWGVSIVDDLRKPLWWLGDDTLFERLFAWAAVSSWKPAAIGSAGVAAWGIACAAPAALVAAIALVIALLLNLRGIALALYAALPSSSDQRGAVPILRVLLAYALMVPPALAGAAGAILLHSGAAAVIGALAISLAETLLLILFAAARICGRGVTFAQAQQL